MQRWMNIVIVLLLTLMSVATAMLSLSTLSDRYSRIISDYPQQSRSVFLTDIAQESSNSALDLLKTKVTGAHGIIIRTDSKLADNDEGAACGYLIGVFGDVQRHPDDARLTAFGSTVFDATILSKLLRAEQHATLGLDQNRADMIADLPNVRYGTSVTVMQLDRLAERSGTVNGEYRIIGLSQSQYDALVSSLSAATGISTERLQQPLHGSDTTDNLQRTIAECLLAAAAILLTVILVLGAYQQFSTLGIHIMLGWSRIGYAWMEYRPMLLWSLVTLPIIAAGVFWGVTSFPISGQLTAYCLTRGIVVCALALLAACLGSCVFLTVHPVDAIRNRISKRGLLVVLVILYCCSSGALVAGGTAMDSPMREVQHLSAIRASWSPYRSMRLLYHETPGTNQSSFTGQSSEHFKETYEWYSSIAGQQGAYIANMTHYNEDNLQSWKTIYHAAPEQPFWQLDASPNYLTDQGFAIPQGVTYRAKRGERIFLIPDTWTARQRTAMEKYQKLDSEHNAEWKGSIVTSYMKHRDISFVTYHPSVKLFTWNTDGTLPNWTTDPVILVCTPENMTPFEGENLSAVGLDNSMIKLSEPAAQQYTTRRYFAQYHLEDNNPQYIPVDDFIAGLTKTATQTIQFFGLAMAFLAALELVLSIAMCRIFAATYRTRIAVKRLLGYPLVSIFAPTFLTVVLVSTMSIAIAAFIHSTAAFAFTALLAVLQTVILLSDARRIATKELATMIAQE